MSLSLATKGRLHGGVTTATSGVIYVFGAVVSLVQAIIPELVFRRASVVKVFKRVSVDKIFRREDV